MTPKPRFTRDQLQSTALDLIDKGGLRALSMRSLASKLGTGAMTVYNYVRNRDELDTLTVDAVFAEMRWPQAQGNWLNDVRGFAEAAWLAIHNHPNVIPLILSRRPLQINLECREVLLQALARSGRSKEQLLAALHTVLGFVHGFALSYQSREWPSDQETLTPNRFPMLIKLSKISKQVDPKDVFRAGLNIVMAGLAATSKNLRQGVQTQKAHTPRQ
jgi:AcrR family transcriptional regulator